MSEIDKRIFVVGCSRSGTTLLQVLLASHPDLTSFPETNFFWSAVGDKRKVLAQIGLPTGLESKAIRHTIDLLGLDQDEYSIPPFFVTFSSAVDEYIRILDDQALKEGKSIWVEKTPYHVYRIDFIKRYVDNPIFVHIIRDGRDVVASICDRARKYPNQFGLQRDPSYGIQLWNETVAESLRRMGKKGHVFTTYRRIVENTEDEMRRLCNCLGIQFHQKMIKGDSDTQKKVVPENRPWIHKAKKKPDDRKKSKFELLFDNKEKKEISNKLNLDAINELKFVQNLK